jgi:CHAT domain-containing protein
VSSYTPTLSALINTREKWTPVAREQLTAMLVAEANAPGAEQLFSVDEEVFTAAGLLQSMSIKLANDVYERPTLDVVKSTLREAQLLHLACHGQQHPDPLKSRFLLRDEPLMLSDIMKLKLPNAVCAYLSACETAKGDSSQPDLAIHLAASLLFCGFRSVIATMW